MISAYPDKVKNTWKNAILISVSHFPITIFAVVIPILIGKVAVQSGEWLVGVFSILLFFGCALLAYINCFFINNIFHKITGDAETETVEDDENMPGLNLDEISSEESDEKKDPDSKEESES